MSKKLSNAVVMKLWKSLDKPSLQRVKNLSGDKGYINPMTNKSYSRQWMRVLMSETPEGRMALGRPPSSERIIALQSQRIPLIVEDNTAILNWYIENGFTAYETISSDKVTLEKVENRYVYGDIPVSLAIYARSVFLPTLFEGKCTLKELKIRLIR